MTVPSLVLSAGETRFLEFAVLAPVPSSSIPSLLLLAALLLGTGLAVMLRRGLARA